MKILNDNERGLMICSFEDVNCLTGADVKFFDEFTQEANSWKDPRIKNFLLKHTEAPLGFHFNNCAEKSPFKNVFYAFEDGKLVAISLITSNLRVLEKEQVVHHIEKLEEKKLSELKGYLSLKQAQNIVLNDNFNSTYLELIAVKPGETGKGIGSRFISCVKNNIDFFDHYFTPTHNTLSASIHEANAWSIKAFTKYNDFKPIIETDKTKLGTLHDYYLPFDCELEK